MAEYFTKLFSSITDSSIWLEDNETRLVWITILAMADKHGNVMSSVPGLAHRARVTHADAQRAIELFLSPDAHSRSKAHEGRRLSVIDRGWRILNYQKFREMRSNDARKEQNRAAQQRHRQKLKEKNKEKSIDCELEDNHRDDDCGNNIFDVDDEDHSIRTFDTSVTGTRKI